MDVTEKTDLSSLFDFDSPSTSEASREGESEVLNTNKKEPLRVMVDLIPCSISEERWRKPNEEEDLKVYTRRRPMVEERWRKPNEEENLKVYTRMQSRHEQQAPRGEQLAPRGVEIVELTHGETCTTQTPSNTRDSMDFPIALRKGIRVGNPRTRHSDEHDIANYVSYTYLRTTGYSLQSVMIPRDWKATKKTQSDTRQ
jgi:hypothetical protein